jgi:hypothetical protein
MNHTMLSYATMAKMTRSIFHVNLGRGRTGLSMNLPLRKEKEIYCNGLILRFVVIFDQSRILQASILQDKYPKQPT